MEMRPPMNDFDMRVYDTYWALNRAHKGLDVALTSISMDAKWKDCQKAALLAEEKVEDAIEIAKSLPAEGKGWMAPLLSIRLHVKKAAAQNPEMMKMALMQALRLTMETEEVIRRFYEKRAAPHATPHVTPLEHLKASRKKRPYGVSRNKRMRMRKRSGHKRSGHKRSGHKRSGHKRSGHKRSDHKRTQRKSI